MATEQLQVVLVSHPQVLSAVQAVAALLQTDTSAVVTLQSSGLDRPSKLDGTTYASYGARCYSVPFNQHCCINKAAPMGDPCSDRLLPCTSTPPIPAACIASPVIMLNGISPLTHSMHALPKQLCVVFTCCMQLLHAIVYQSAHPAGTKAVLYSR